MIATLAQYKAYNTTVGMTDALLTSFLYSATNIVETYLGYDPQSQVYTETLDGNGGNLIQLNAKPITTITSITINGAVQSVADFIAREQYLIKKNGENVFSLGYSNVVVQYTAGYLIEAPVTTLTPTQALAQIDAIVNAEVPLTTEAQVDAIEAIIALETQDEYDVNASLIKPIIQLTTFKIADIMKNDYAADGKISISTPDGGTRVLPSYLNFDKQLSQLETYRIRDIV